MKDCSSITLFILVCVAIGQLDKLIVAIAIKFHRCEPDTISCSLESLLSRQ